MIYALISLGALLLLILGFAAVLYIRAKRFNPLPQPEVADEEICFDKDAATAALQQLVRCKTISYNDKSLEDDQQFQKLIDLLPQLYPHVFNKCTFQQLPDRALLLKWPGKSSEAPSVMMAHYDVVPVDEEKWEKPAFEGIIEDGVLWGRGTLDTKVTFNSALFGADHLIAEGFVPENDVYFAFSGGEEINGKGAVNIVNYFKENGIQPALVLDEGGAVVENVFPGVTVPCGLIGIAEKGMMNVRYTARSNGGHASAPLPATPITSLARACRRVVENPFPLQITTPAGEMFNILARHSTLLYKMIFANLWCFKPVLDFICVKQGGDMNALLRTTTAFTQAQGSNARNVIPTEASLVSNMRLNPADTVESATAYLHKIVADESIQIEVLECFEPSPISQLNCESWDKVATAVAQTWNGCVVAPYLMVQCSDSRHYRDLCDKVYRFSAMDLTSDERKTIHGNNERIRLDCLHRSVEFYIRLLKKC